MKYVVDVNGERIAVSLEAGGARVDGTLFHTHIADLEGTPIQLVHVGGEVHRVAVRRGASRGEYTLWIDGHRYQVDAVDERTRTIRDLTSGATAALGPRPLLAPMPGLVVRIHVKPGEQVEAGQGLVAMEAMKMENELRSLSAGTVKRVCVSHGQAVEKGAILVELE